MKPYQQVPIQDCLEPLVAIEPERFALVEPHPYQQLGAPYGGKSPFYVRAGVLAALADAQTELQHRHPGWRIQIFDAYRPVAVQQFMVDFTFNQLFEERGKTCTDLTASQREAILEKVYQFWAKPSLDPATPPPHSTGGAVDVTLVGETGEPVDMGSPIDEVSPRSYPYHFAGSAGAKEREYHQNRQLLGDIMVRAGFQRHPHEWWHFCLGDQMWAWLTNKGNSGTQIIARYGRIE